MYIGEECCADREDDDASDVAACEVVSLNSAGESSRDFNLLEASVDKMKRCIADGTMLTKFEVCSGGYVGIGGLSRG